MYLRTETGSGHGLGETPLGLGPVAEKVIEVVGGVIIEKLFESFVGNSNEGQGNFTSQSNLVNLKSETRSPNQPPFQRCTMRFPLTAHLPSINPLYGPLLLATTSGRIDKQDFWFELSFEYDGNDVQGAMISPLLQKTGKPFGRFNIAFTGDSYKAATLPGVAKVIFRVSGQWTPDDSSTSVSLKGFVTVWGNGFVGIDIGSELDWVLSSKPPDKKCPIRPHYLPPPAKPKVHFSLPVLFPYGVSKVSPPDKERIRRWAYCLPSRLRDKMAAGEITVYIEGYASRPGAKERNQLLSEQRASNVMSVLAGPIGLNPNVTRFIPRFHGNNLQPLPGLLDVIGLVKRVLNPNKYDQAAVIHFDAEGIDDKEVLEYQQCQ